MYEIGIGTLKLLSLIINVAIIGLIFQCSSFLENPMIIGLLEKGPLEKRVIEFNKWYDLCKMTNDARKLFWSVAFWIFIGSLTICCFLICFLSSYYEYEYSHGRTYHRYSM